MANNDDDKKIKSVDELIAESKKSQTKPVLAEKKVTEKFEEKIEEIRVKELEDATKKQAAKKGAAYVNLAGFPINSDSLNSIPKETAARLKTICFNKTDELVKIGSTDPEKEEVKNLLAELAKDTYTGKGETYLISENSFHVAFKLYEKFPPAREFVAGVQISGDELQSLKKELKNFGVLNARLNEEKNVTQIIKILMAGALQAEASDIHIEAEENKITIRYRIDGVLHIVATLPKGDWQKVDSRIKNIAGLKINVSDKPQDGRITLFMKELGKLEIRVSTLPTSYGASIVMRLLSSKIANLKFEDLGLIGKSYENLKKQVERPTGMIVTTGPTGSGKTTTLYAILNKLNNPETKIITLEDPIEYKLEGISQSQIDHSKNYSFADGLRSILRQDPDIIMVGELRDLETCEVAIQAALTGHEVVSTLHTNDAAGAIPRFLSMGVKPYLLAPSLNAVIGQRLVRKIHDKCKIEEKLEPEQLAKVKEILSKLPPDSGHKINLDNLKFYRGQGCDECNHIGLKGRIGIYEILTLNSDIEKEILGGKTSEYKMAELAYAEGMVTMAQDGLLKALDGTTTVDEVFRVAE